MRTLISAPTAVIPAPPRLFVKRVWMRAWIAITDADCTDGLYCNGAETCVNNVCQGGSSPCPDDGVFCNGAEGCDENTDQCTHSGDPCTLPTICEESTGACVDCITDADCTDGLYCNGAETCVNYECQGGSNPCPDDGVFCNGRGVR